MRSHSARRWNRRPPSNGSWGSKGRYVAEALEPRVLRAASTSLQGSTMVVHGAENIANNISVYRQTSGSLVIIDAVIEVQTSPVQQVHNGFNVNSVTAVRIEGGSQRDQLDV